MFLAIKMSLAEVCDIITISETHLHAGIPDDFFDLTGFHNIIRNDRSWRWRSYLYKRFNSF